MAYYGKTPTPLRITLNGTSTSQGNHTFFHVYEITLIAPLTPVDDNFFSVSKIAVLALRHLNLCTNLILLIMLQVYYNIIDNQT